MLTFSLDGKAILFLFGLFSLILEIELDSSAFSFARGKVGIRAATLLYYHTYLSEPIMTAYHIPKKPRLHR